MTAVRPPSRLSLSALLGVPWGLWLGWASLANVIIGVFWFPAADRFPMPLPIAAGLLLVAAAGLFFTGRPRLLVLLPIVGAYLPSLQIGFAALLLSLAYFLADSGGERLARRLDGFDWLLLSVLLWCLVSWLVNLGPETDFWSLPVFALTFLAPWMLVFVARAAPWTARELFLVIGVWLALAVSQVAPALLKPAVIGEPAAYTIPLLLIEIARVPLLQTLVGTTSADMITGSMQSAHHLGVALIITMAFLGALAATRTRRVSRLMMAAIAFCFLMTDSKHVIVAALVPAAVFVARVQWPTLSSARRRQLQFAGAAILLVVVPLGAARVSDIVVNGIWKPYIVLATINPKAQLILRTAAVIGNNDLQTWVGHGPGSFATRAATIRATDVLFKEGNRLPAFIPPHTGASYRTVAYDLYTSEIADQARFRSGALTNPFSSLVGIIGEFGLAGSLLVGSFFLGLAGRGYRLWARTDVAPAFRAAGATVGFAIPLMLLLGLFDSYLEQPGLTGIVAVMAVVVLAASDLPAGAGSGRPTAEG